MTNKNPIPVRLEDEYEDVIGKAINGRNLDKNTLMQDSGLSMLEIEAALQGTFESRAAYAMAAPLGLNAEALCSLGAHSWYPEIEKLPDGLAAFNAPYPVPGYQEMTVNGFIAFDPDSREAIGFDCGPTVPNMLSFAESENLRWNAIAITHSHEDHISHFSELKKACPSAVLYAANKSLDKKIHPLKDGEQITVGRLEITVRETPGHAQDGLSFFIEGLEIPVAVVGDAVFAASVGGIRQDYEGSLAKIRDRILGLPPETLILPGHGPVSSVNLEKQNNCFFAQEE